MAKKKVSRSSNDQQVAVAYQKPIELSREASMEDHDSSEEKFQNLKSLNAILLKQTMDKRHQIESLSQTKDALETELARFGTEKTLLHDELRGSSDENLALRLELDLFMGFVESRFKEMGFGVDLLVKEKSDRDCEIKDLRREANDLILKIENQSREFIRVCEEKDSIKSGFDLKSEEVNRLKESVVRMEKKELSLVEEAGKLRSLNDRMVKEMKKRDGLVQRVKEEKTDLEKTLVEKIREMNDLKSEIKGLVKEKMEVEMVERDQKGMIVKLEKKLGALNEIVESLTKEEKGLRDQVIGLEKELDGVKEVAKAKEDHINALVKEKSIKESELEGLLVENNSIKKQVEMTLEESSYKEKLVDHLVGEKSELAKRNALQDKEIVELKELADEQKRAAAQLRKDYNDQTKTSEKLSCNISQLKDALALVEAERDNAWKVLDDEKRSRLALNEKVVELETMNKATSEKLSCSVSQFKDALALVEAERYNALKVLDDEKRSRLALNEKVVELETMNKATSEKLSCSVSQFKNALVRVEAEKENARKALDEEKRSRLAIDEKVEALETKIEATSEKLNCSGSQLKDALALVEAERDNAGKALDEERRSRLALNEKIVELEKMIEATREKLSCSGSQLKDALALVEAERDNAGKALDEGKRTRLALNEKIVELEKIIDANRKEFEKVKGEKGRLTKEKKELENRSEYLRKEKGNLQKDIMERERAMAALKTELESARTNAKRGLTMLTSVSTQVCGVEIKKSKQKRDNGKDSYSVELEAIKNAFKNKESVVAEMKKEVEKMKHSVEDAHKKKSFWTIVSSVATLFMVASAAYAAAIK